MTLLGGGLAPSRDQTIPQLVAYRKVTTIAYERRFFTRGSYCSELIRQNFNILGWRWSGARGGCLWRFDCSQFSSSALMERITFTANGKRRQIQVENFSKKKMSALKRLKTILMDTNGVKLLIYV